MRRTIIRKPSKRQIAFVLGCTERHFHRLFDDKYVPPQWRAVPDNEMAGYKADILQDLQRGAWLHLNGTDSARQEVEEALSEGGTIFDRLFALQRMGQKYQKCFDLLGNGACEVLRIPYTKEEL